jgi:hypothetical protein
MAGSLEMTKSLAAEIRAAATLVAAIADHRETSQPVTASQLLNQMHLALRSTVRVSTSAHRVSATARVMAAALQPTRF